MKNLFNHMNAMLLLAALITFSACGDDENDEPSVEANSMIKLYNDATLGDVLTDANGVTLYVFAKDVAGSSNCTEGCLDSWPIFYAKEAEISSGLESADFGVITHANGAKQTTYKGWPLYYYAPAGDGELEAANNTSGEAIGGVWFVAKPNYTIMYANAQLVGNDGKNYTSDYAEGDGSTAYFVNSQGRTIYTFASDSKDTNNFTASDFSNDGVWPVYTKELDAVVSSIDMADFGTIDVFGESQVTYKGWPLYYYGQDTERGDTKGVSVPSPGVWPIVNKNIAAAE
ncbi:Secreted repeat of unknown function [Reichenbachiella faecimaris]|uniref:Lipoprotein with Yx(FWY)xxD motif n=1 Tax=Reichenbachiella faecimaris TaxID=692418 RepID=A0A1W2G7X5_REIFA|nr:hypothetical protein [Reichenbachiella faecimaris]SMD32785.1 Secreted repeat of unknown function [Reichenbachiella faecimaris]